MPCRIHIWQIPKETKWKWMYRVHYVFGNKTLINNIKNSRESSYTLGFQYCPKPSGSQSLWLSFSAVCVSAVTSRFDVPTGEGQGSVEFIPMPHDVLWTEGRGRYRWLKFLYWGSSDVIGSRWLRDWQWKSLFCLSLQVVLQNGNLYDLSRACTWTPQPKF